MLQVASLPRGSKLGALLGLLLLAFLSNAVIGVAQASATEPTWYVDGEELEGLEEAQFGGDLYFLFPGGSNLSCSVSGGEGIVSNEGGSPPAEAELTWAPIASEKCGTNLPSCVISEASTYAFPWDAHFIEGETLEIENVHFRANFQGSCGWVGSGKRNWSGTLSGAWDNDTGCVTYAENTFTFEGSGVKAATSGKLCFTGAEGKTLTTAPFGTWSQGGSPLAKGKINSVAFSAGGEVSLTTGTGFSIGPCQLEVEGSVWNGTHTAEGQIDSVDLLEGCYQTNVPNCGVSEITDKTEAPWSLSAGLDSEGESRVNVDGIGFTAHFPSSCSYGIPSTVRYSGMLTGIYNEEENGCIVFNKAGELAAVGYPVAVYADGEVCVEAEGGMLTLG